MRPRYAAGALLALCVGSGAHAGISSAKDGRGAATATIAASLGVGASLERDARLGGGGSASLLVRVLTIAGEPSTVYQISIPAGRSATIWSRNSGDVTGGAPGVFNAAGQDLVRIRPGDGRAADFTVAIAYE
ncbi:MAG TPA: hypothetical protein VII73_03185 [Caulobacteraceae bacterium]